MIVFISKERLRETILTDKFPRRLAVYFSIYLHSTQIPDVYTLSICLDITHREMRNKLLYKIKVKSNLVAV
jgi:hypothetical protein